MFNIFKKKKALDIVSPMTGEIVTLEQVPDQVFSGRMIGDGAAIAPAKGTVVAPCSGKLSQIFPTNHAIGIETKEGLEILIHIGIDTVELKGEGFKRLLEPGVQVEAGTPIIEVDLELLKKNEKALSTPVVITNMDLVDKIDVVEGAGEAGQTTMMKVTLK